MMTSTYRNYDPIEGTSLGYWLAPLLLTLLAAVTFVYWIGRGGGFAFDDNINIISNPTLHVTRLVWGDWIAAMFSSPASEMQRPLAMLTFAINNYFTGLDPMPMKLTNIAIHLVNTLLVFGLSRSVIRAYAPFGSHQPARKEWAALFTAACWALHPINLMAVLYVVQRMESLCHTFVFAGLWMYVSGRHRQIAGRNGWGLILGGLLGGVSFGVLSKESAVLLPLYAFSVELCLFHFRRDGEHRETRLYWLYIFLLLLPALAGLAWLLPRVTGPGAYGGRDFSLTERLLTEPRVVLDYLHWTLFPDLGQLSLYHDDYVISRSLLNPPVTLVGLLAMPILLAMAWLCHKRRPLMALGLLWFLGAQLLTATIIPLELVFEHRNYFASLGICLALADLLLLAPDNKKRRRAGGLLAILFLLFFAGITHLRAIEWNNPVHFALSEVAKHPQSPRATYTLARTMVILSDYKSDSPFIGESWKSLQRAREVPRSGILPDQAILMFAARLGAPLQPIWWQDMQDRLRANPVGPQEQSAIGSLVDCSVQKLCNFPPDDMLATFAAAMRQKPVPEVLNVYANYSVMVLDDTDLALRLWREAVALSPRTAQYRVNLAMMLIELGRADEAQVQIDQLRKLGWLGQNDARADLLQARLKAAIPTSVRKSN
jgi:hypothetical protein